MSLIRIAARIAAVQALKGKTLVGDNVLDSQIGTLDVTAEGEPRTDEDRPFISVYSNSSKANGNETALRSMVVNGSTEFLFEFGITTAHMVTDGETGAQVVHPGIPGTDAALEFFLDMIARQIGDALSDPENEWAEIFRKFCRTFIGVERLRTSGAENGVRLAAQQIRIDADIIADPLAGQELKPAHPLAMFFAKVEASDDEALKAQAELMMVPLYGPSPDTAQAIRRYGMTRGEADNLLLLPPGGIAEVGIGEVSFEAVPA